MVEHKTEQLTNNKNLDDQVIDGKTLFEELNKTSKYVK